MGNKRVALLLWVVVTLSSLLFIGFRISHGVVVETNIMKLLPTATQDRVVHQANELLTQSFERRVAFTISTHSYDTALILAQEFLEDAQKTSLFATLESAFTQEQEKQWFTYYYPQRYRLLPTSIRDELQDSSAVHNFIQREYSLLYSPMPDYYGEGLDDDPLMLFAEFAQSQIKSEGEIEEGFLLFDTDSMVTVLLHGVVAHSPFSVENQRALEQFIAQQQIRIASKGGTLAATGVVRYAALAFDKGRVEASTIGVLSLVGIVLLVLLVFRSFKVLLFGLLPIAIGLIWGIAAGIFVFGTLHIITLTMAGCLIGVVVDYTFHFLADHAFYPQKWKASEAVKRIYWGITLGALTTALGYVAFLFTPLPGLKQIALVTVVGLSGAWWSVVVVFPLLFKEERKQLPYPPFLMKILLLIDSVSSKALYVVLGILGIFVFVGLWGISSDDNIESLKTVAPQLDKEEEYIRSFLPSLSSSQYLLVKGHSQEQVLQRLEKVGQSLDSLVAVGELSGYVSVAQALPSISRQSENRELLLKMWQDSSYLLRSTLQEIGFSEQALSTLDTDLRAAVAPMSVKDLLENQSVFPLRHSLWIEDSTTVASIILLEGENLPTAHLKSLALEHQEVYAINRIATISTLLKEYREHAMVVVLLAYGVIALLLFARYGLYKMLGILLVPFGAGAFSFALLNLFGVPINLFHALALLLVLGIGVDYTIFFAEGGNRKRETVLAVLLAALSTLLAFGMLIFSTTPALSSIGAVIVPGIIISLIFSPFVTRIKGRDQKSEGSQFRFSIGKKLLLGFMPLVLVVALISIGTLLRLNSVVTISQQIINNDMEVRMYATRLLDILQNREYNLRKALIYNSDEMYRLVSETSLHFANDIDALRKLDLYGLEDTLIAVDSQYQIYLNQYVNHHARGSSSTVDSLDLLRKEVYLTEKGLLESLKKEASNKQRSHSLVAVDLVKKTIREVLLVSIIGIVLSLLLLLVIVHIILRAVRKLKEASELVSKGTFTHLPTVRNQDELGELSQSFNTMAIRLFHLEEAYKDASPLTRLPGGVAIESIVQQRIDSGIPFAFCLLDLDNFKPFNDRYGYSRGNDVIKKTAEIISEMSMSFGDKDDFVGHIGGDDFVLITSPEKFEMITNAIIEHFDKEIVQFYDTGDVQNGYIVSTSRDGAILKFPIMSISIAVVLSEVSQVMNSIEIGEIVAELKKFAKKKKYSNIVVDRRKKTHEKQS